MSGKFTIGLIQRAVAADKETTVREHIEAIREAVHRADPEGVVIPYCMGGGTDAKAFARLGIAGYGFAPLGEDPEGRTREGVHGVDERVPVASLLWGAKVLDDFLLNV